MSLGKTIRNIKVQLSAPVAVVKSKTKATVAKAIVVPASKPLKATSGAHLGAVLLPRLVTAVHTHDTSFQHSALIRASNAHTYCPRAEAIERMYGDPSKALSVSVGKGYDDVTLEAIDEGPMRLELAATLVLGKAIHHYYQNEVLGPTGIIVGRWVCLRCACEWGGTTVDDWVPHPHFVEKATGKCPAPSFEPALRVATGCGHPRIELIEANAKDEKLGVGGHMDGGIVHAGDRIGLEIKSMSEKMINNLKRPLSAHVIQGTIYCYLFNLPRILFLYVGKGWHPEGGKAYPVGEGFSWGPYKEFMIEPRWDIIAALRLAREKAVAAAELYHDSGFITALPKKLSACKNPRSGRCEECPVAAICWSID